MEDTTINTKAFMVTDNSNDGVSVLSDIVTKLLDLKTVVQKIDFNNGLHICCSGTDYNYWRTS